jgi:hypothetical protein
MPFRRPVARLLVPCLMALAVSSCGVVRRRVFNRIGGNAAQPLLTADKATLVSIITRNYGLASNFNATVDMTPAIGSAEKNKITEYRDVRAYILFRKPADIRIIGLYPVVRGKAFDMVSDGMEFKLHIPSKDRFVVGKNAIDTPSPNKIENLRPQHFLEALLVRPPADPAKLVMENLTDEENAFYILHEIVENGGGELNMKRSLWFNRFNLTLSRQIVFNAAGNIESDARYDRWRNYDAVSFPQHIEINRPQDEYGVVIDIVKMEVNKGLADERFALSQPEGTKLQVLGPQPDQAPSRPPAPVPQKKGR